MKKRNFLGEILFYGIILAVIVAVISGLSLGGKQEPVIYSDVMSYLEQNQVKSVYVSNKNVLTLTVLQADGSTKDISYTLTSFDAAVIRDKIEEARAKDGSAIETVEYQPASQNTWWINLLPWILILVLAVAAFVLIVVLKNRRTA